jgi:alpha-1,3-rhamnosyl/mannosyltransferase
VRHLPNVADSELPALYSGASAFVYPSLYEGFGLPVLEAMQCGCPVITSNDPAIAEVVGDAALRVPCEDTEALTAAMTRILRNPSERAALCQAGLARAAQFSWRETARRTREVYAAACNQS